MVGKAGKETMTSITPAHFGDAWETGGVVRIVFLLFVRIDVVRAHRHYVP